MNALLSLCCAVFALPPQSPPDGRDRAFGIARRADRSPWAGATVRLVSEPFVGAERDVVERVTDERGEFRANVLVGQPYTVWAFARDGERWLVSQRVTDAVPRLPIVLDEAGSEPRVRARVRGLTAWGTATVTLWSAGERSGACAQPLRVAEGTEVDLPPTATGERWLFPQADNGLDMLRRLVPADTRGTFDVELPPPRDVALTVHTPAGHPVRGAQLEIRTLHATVLPPRTNRDGRMTVVVPQANAVDTDVLPLWVTAPDHLTGRLWQQRLDDAATWRALVQPSEVPHAALAWRDEAPLAGAHVWLGGVAQHIEPDRKGPGGRPNPSFAKDGLYRTDADGNVALPYEPGYPLSVAAQLPRAGLAELERRHGGAISALALLLARVPDQAPLSAHIDRLRPVRFVFEHADHAPAPRAHARLGGGASPGLGLDYVADQASAITVLLPPQPDIMLAVWHANAGDVVRVDVPPAFEAGIATVRVQLPAPLRVTGKVLDAGGQGVADATVQLGATLRGDRSEWQPVDDAGTADARAPRIVARGYYYQPMAEAMFQRSVRTDAAGLFAIELPGRGYPLEFRVAHAGRASATEWREAEAAGGGNGDVLLVLR